MSASVFSFLPRSLAGNTFVKHEAVALAEILYYVLENPVLNFARILVQDKKLAFIAPAGRLFCDLLTWKIELEL